MQESSPANPTTIDKKQGVLQWLWRNGASSEAEEKMKNRNQVLTKQGENAISRKYGGTSRRKKEFST